MFGIDDARTIRDVDRWRQEYECGAYTHERLT
jgi:hypothetical protein